MANGIFNSGSGLPNHGPIGSRRAQFDDNLLEEQQKAYAVQGVDEAEPAQPRKKRKLQGEHDVSRADPAQSQSKRAGAAPCLDQTDLIGLAWLISSGQDRENTGRKQRAAPEPRERKNTAVYVTNLPSDTTADELAGVFSKCGVIAESMEHKTPRIKLYTDDAGAPKGDALIVYFRAESVALAVQMLDDTDLRLGATGAAGRMRVAPAEFKYKTQKEVPAKQTEGEKKQLVKKAQKLNSKLADWDDDDVQEVQRVTKWQKTVVLKHMFTLDELTVRVLFAHSGFGG